MKTYLEADEQSQSDTEITLGTRSILGIFFGLALICGVFFGFGYSVGRANISRAAASMKAISHLPGVPGDAPSSAVQTVVEDQDSPASAANQDTGDSDSGNSLPKPSGALAESQPAAAGTPAGSNSSAESALPQQTTPAAVVTANPAAAGPPSAAATAVPVAYLGASAPESANIMVQIAAVSRREDADVLITALGKHGYRASIRTGTADSLLHVQIGPFATRDEAKAMRTKLLNDGYNAILK